MAYPTVYDFLDLPVRDLPGRERTLLRAMRGWVHALTMGADPGGAALAALADHPGAAAAFDRTMRALDAGSDEAMTFQRPCHALVDETEAVLLALWARADDRAGTRAALALMLDADGAAGVAEGMGRVSGLLALAPVRRD